MDPYWWLASGHTEAQQSKEKLSLLTILVEILESIQGNKMQKELEAGLVPHL